MFWRTLFPIDVVSSSANDLQVLRSHDSLYIRHRLFVLYPCMLYLVVDYE